MTDATHVRRLQPLERTSSENLEPARPSTLPADAAPIVCRTSVVRVNLGRLLADLELEARRLLGGALYE
jgi:hypothetical protein